MNTLDIVKINREVKTRDKNLAFNLEELVNTRWYLQYMLHNIILGTRYSMLIRVSYSNEMTGEHTEYKMLGDQMSLFCNDEEELSNKLLDIRRVITKRLRESMEIYRYNEYHVIDVQMLLFVLGVKPVIKSSKLTSKKIGEQKDLINFSKIQDSYKFTDAIHDLRNKGNPLKKIILGNKLKYIILNNGNKLDIMSVLELDKYSNICNNDSMFYEYVDGDDRFIIIANGDEKLKRIYTFTEGGTYVDKVVYEYLSIKKYSRTSGNVTVFVDDKGIYRTDYNIKFGSVYPYKRKGKLKNMVNPDWRIGTLDLETYKDGDISKTYAIGFYTKNSMNVFYLEESLDSDKLIIKCLNEMLVDKFNGYTFYTHNLTNYDIYFILRVIIANSDIYECKPYFRDDSIIGLKLSNKKGNNVYSIKIVDSWNLLQGSLFDLCTAFDTPVKKSYFPYNFVNSKTIFYKGDKPHIFYYNHIDASKNIPLEEYNGISPNDWDLKEETITYLGNDLLSLFNVMEQFINRVFINYNVQVTDNLTISSLSMDIYLRRFYTGSGIPLIKKKSVYNDIKKSYYGGVTEVYKPYGNNLYYYDVNSLYPYSALNKMPGNDCVYTDNIDKSLDELVDLFGFFYCKVEASDKYIGLLPYRADEGLTMPIGKFEGWYFSEELKFAHENGYKIHIVKGYNFNVTYDPFSSYVRDLYKIKSTTKEPVEKTLVKSLLNNLLGRFGLDIDKYTTSLVTHDEFKNIIQTRRCKSVKFIEDKILISYEKNINKHICSDHGLEFKNVIGDLINSTSNNILEDNYHDVSVVISSAVTAYSRVYMNKIKLNILDKGGSIYYTDTDSIVTNIKMDDHLVGTGIGQFKLVHEIKEGYFISNKTYGLISNENGKEVTTLKHKGVYKGQLTYDSLKSLFNNNKVESLRYETVKSLSKGSAVLFVPETIRLSPDSYEKRIKIFNKNNVWIDTKPIRKGFHTYSNLSKRNAKFDFKRLLKLVFYFMIFALSISFLLILCIFLCYNYLNCDINDKIIESIIENERILEFSNEIEKPVKSYLWDYVNNSFIELFKTKGSNNNFKPYAYEIYFKSNIDSQNLNRVRVLEAVLKEHLRELSAENDTLRNEILFLRHELLNSTHINNNIIDKLIKEIDVFIKK